MNALLKMHAVLIHILINKTLAYFICNDVRHHFTLFLHVLLQEDTIIELTRSLRRMLAN